MIRRLLVAALALLLFCAAGIEALPSGQTGSAGDLGVDDPCDGSDSWLLPGEGTGAALLVAERLSRRLSRFPRAAALQRDRRPAVPDLPRRDAVAGFHARRPSPRSDLDDAVSH